MIIIIIFMNVIIIFKFMASMLKYVRVKSITFLQSCEKHKKSDEKHIKPYENHIKSIENQIKSYEKQYKNIDAQIYW